MKNERSLFDWRTYYKTYKETIIRDLNIGTETKEDEANNDENKEAETKEDEANNDKNKEVETKEDEANNDENKEVETNEVETSETETKEDEANNDENKEDETKEDENKEDETNNDENKEVVKKNITKKDIVWNHWKTYGEKNNFTFFRIPSNRKMGKDAMQTCITYMNDKYMKILQIENTCYPEKHLVKKEKLTMKTFMTTIHITGYGIRPFEKENTSNDYLEIHNTIQYFLNDAGKEPDSLVKMSLFLKNLYEKKIKSFVMAYKILDINIILNDPVIEFRYFCYKYLDFMRNCFVVPELALLCKYEAVFIEFRELDHIEFIIRNAIMQLGSNWSYTVVCGNENYNFMITLCNNICKNIKIIKTTFNSMSRDKYSDYLKTTAFWHLLVGEKVLIYQEDSFIFNNNIEEFLDYDYIGAPWIDRVLPICVGNGGLSLRTKKIMIHVIEKINKDNIHLQEIISEDVFFSKHMQRLKIGKIAEEEVASRFSSELICNKESFGGHQFWLSDSKWKRRMYNAMHKLLLRKSSL
jgi:hypothetical protein